MSVPAYRRKTGKLEVIVKARQIFEQVIISVKNPNKFDPLYWDIFTKDLVYTLEQSYIKLWRANNIRVDSPEDYLKRKALQEEAILGYQDFLGLLSPAVKIYHLPTKRMDFWAGEVERVLALARAWKKSDYERYGRIK